MSGHSKWSTIKHKKGAADAKRGKVFTKHAKLITIAAQQGGGDPEMNSSLRTAIDSAKLDNVPNANIDRAIKRGTGSLKDNAIIEEVSYEGYGPTGIAVIVDCLTDNKNRTFANVKNIITKEGGNIGESGCVSWMFEKKGVIQIKVEGDKDETELKVIDFGAEDIQWNNDILVVFTTIESFEQVKKALKEEFKIESAELEMIPKTPTVINNVENARRVLKFLNQLNEDDDVSNVWANFDIPDEIMAQVGEI